MNLDVAGVYHQPLKVPVVDDRWQQLVPDATIAPATKAPIGGLPIPVSRREITPEPAPNLMRERPSTQNPKHLVKKQSEPLGLYVRQ